MFRSNCLSINKNQRITIILILILTFLASGLNAQVEGDIRKKRKKNKTTRIEKSSLPKQKNIIKQKINKFITDTLTGVILDSLTQDPLVGAYILLMNTQLGAISDGEGNFRIILPKSINQSYSFTHVLEIRLTGYENRKVTFTNHANELVIYLREDAVALDEVVISAMRMEEKIKESASTITKLNLRDIRNNPSTNTFDVATNLSSIHYTSSAFTVKTLNARAFGEVGIPRFLHRIDGMEMYAPTTGIQYGSLVGVSDLDYENIEIITGPASSLYGPNAFNGMINITGKDPFQYPGMSYRVRMGFNNLNPPNLNHHPLQTVGNNYVSLSGDRQLQPLYEVNTRYAHVFNPKLAAKINIGYQGGKDMIANDFRSVNEYDGDLQGKLGYDGINVYGDEVNKLLLINSPIYGTKRLRMSRSGYREQDLISYNSRVFNLSTSVHYRPDENTTWIFQNRINYGSYIFQVGQGRYFADGALLMQNKAELQKKSYFIRLYLNTEYSDNTYDIAQLATSLNSNQKGNSDYMRQMSIAFSGGLNPYLKDFGLPTIEPGNDIEARRFADSDNTKLSEYLLNKGETKLGTWMKGKEYLTPGTPEFNTALAKIKSLYKTNGGARLFGKSNLLHLEGQLKLHEHIKFLKDRKIDLLLGGNLRWTEADSRGQVFIDSMGQAISLGEGGIYIQGTGNFINRQIKIIGTLRTDKAQYFSAQLSPRLSVTFRSERLKEHFFRINFQTAFRNPTFQDRYLNIGTGYNGLALGNRRENIQSYNLDGNIYPLANVSYASYFLWNGDTAQAKKYLGHTVNVPNLRPERISTFEIGYRGSFFEKLNIDFTFFVCRYFDLITSEMYAGPNLLTNRNHTNPPSLSDIATESSTIYIIPSNINKVFNVLGVNPTINYQLNRNISLSSSYTFTRMQDTTDRIYERQYSFNTPRHRLTNQIKARNIFKRLDFVMNHRWYDGCYYLGQWIPSYNVIDLLVSYAIPQTKFIVTFGANNLLNFYHREIYAGPSMGGVYFLQFSFDDLLNQK